MTTTTYRDPSNKGKRKRPLKPSYKSTWTVDQLLKQLINDCKTNIALYNQWGFSAEGLSGLYGVKIDIARAAIQKLRLYIPKGYHINEYNSAPHESSRNKFFWHGPNKGGWCATSYSITKNFQE